MVVRGEPSAECTRAQERHDKLKSELWRAHRLGEKPGRTWDEAGYKFLMETQRKATHHQHKGRPRCLQPCLRGNPLGEIDRELIAHIGQIRAEQSGPANANRLPALIRATREKRGAGMAMNRQGAEHPNLQGRLRPAEVQRLLAELQPHRHDPVSFALSTGLRQSKVVNLESMMGRYAHLAPDKLIEYPEKVA